MSFEYLINMTEEKILRDIRDFEAILSRMPEQTEDTQAAAMRRIYAALLATRRDMLVRVQAVRQ